MGTALSVGSAAIAQTVTGVVLDSVTRQPVAQAVAVLIDPQGNEWDAALTGPDGAFVLEAPALGEYQIRAVGLSHKEVRLPCVVNQDQNTRCVALLPPSPIDLPAVHGSAERRALQLEAVGYYQRKREGFGVFMSAPEIDRRAPTKPSDLFYGVPGARVVRTGGDNVLRDVVLRGGASMSFGGTCFPAVVVDGDIVRRGGQGAAEPLDGLLPHPGEIMGMEVYRGQVGVPHVAVAASPCGTVVVWTKS